MHEGTARNSRSGTRRDDGARSNRFWSGKLYLNGNARVIVADIAASNRAIHAINTVFVPLSAG